MDKEKKHITTADTVLMLADQVQKLGAESSHFTGNNIKHTKGLTSVISIYDGIKPAHMVLEELYEWAEKNDPKLCERIDKMQEDMSWNEQNPV